MPLVRRLAQGRLHYSWIVFAVTFLSLLAAAGIRSTPGVLIVPLEQEFGWSRATISIAVSVNLVLYGLLGPFAVAVMERFGIRRTMTVAMMLVAVGVLLAPLMTQVWQLVLLWGVVVGSGTGVIAMALGALIVSRWFSARRGLVMGMLTASTATGQLVFLPLLAYLVESSGWRSATFAVACGALIALPLIFIFMRDRPSAVGLNRFGEIGETPAHTTHANPVRRAIGILGEGVRSRNFWLLAGSFFICGLSTNGLIGTHLISACIDAGIPEVRGAGLLALMGVFDLFGTTLSGWLSDRYNNRVLLAWYYGLRGLSLIYLPYALGVSTFELTLFAMFYGLDWIATVPPTVRLTTNVWGPEKGPVMFGWFLAAHQIGAAVAASGAGWLRTSLNGYMEAFIISGSFCLLAALMSLAVDRKRKRDTPAGAEAAAA